MNKVETKQQVLRLLVVDDHADILSVLKAGLGFKGYHVECADSVCGALELAEREVFDLVLADWSLPDGTAADLMEHLRKKQPIKGVIFTGYSEHEMGEKWRVAGFERLLIKVADLNDIDQVLRDVAGSGTGPAFAAATG